MQNLNTTFVCTTFNYLDNILKQLGQKGKKVVHCILFVFLYFEKGKVFDRFEKLEDP